MSIRVGGIERSVAYLEASTERSSSKLDSISNDIATAKATFATLKFLFIAFCVGTWGLLSAILIMWLKHSFNW